MRSISVPRGFLLIDQRHSIKCQIVHPYCKWLSLGKYFQSTSLYIFIHIFRMNFNNFSENSFALVTGQPDAFNLNNLIHSKMFNDFWLMLLQQLNNPLGGSKRISHFKLRNLSLCIRDLRKKNQTTKAIGESSWTKWMPKPYSPSPTQPQPSNVFRQFKEIRKGKGFTTSKLSKAAWMKINSCEQLNELEERMFTHRLLFVCNFICFMFQFR